MPPNVETMPRDPRGYPVPATTPWQEGEPRFALTDHGRSAHCARSRLCAVCGAAMPPGRVWRVVDAAETAAIGEALAAERPYRTPSPVPQGPGHRACMLYAAVVCPHLARRDAAGLPTVRRTTATGRPVPGAVRGPAGAVVGFGDYEYAITGTRVLYRFFDVVEYLPHDHSAAHLGELRAELARRPAPR
jgi:hypothetical protein